jgi:hypothetical protein
MRCTARRRRTGRTSLSTIISLVLVCSLKSSYGHCIELIILAGKILKPVIINGREYKPVANALRGPLSTQKGRLGQPGLSANEKQDLIDVQS